MEIDNKVYIDKFDYYQFEYKVSSKNIRGVVATIAPYTEHFGFFYFGFNSVQKIDNLLRRIEFDPFIDGKKIWCGVEDAVIIIDEKEKNIADFQVRLPGFGSVCVHLNIFIEFILEFRKWLVKLESCQIPGIIPEPKLNTWSCVPNEYIKDEWWQIQKQKEIDENGA